MTCWPSASSDLEQLELEYYQYITFATLVRVMTQEQWPRRRAITLGISSKTTTTTGYSTPLCGIHQLKVKTIVFRVQKVANFIIKRSCDSYSNEIKKVLLTINFSICFRCSLTTHTLVDK